MKMNCGCVITKENYINKECKYHEAHCHFLKCKKKLKKGDIVYCKKHDEIMERDLEDWEETFGRSDF